MSELPALPIPREDEIVIYLQSGWHPLKISRTMAKKGIAVSPEQIADYARNLGIEGMRSPLRVLGGKDRVTDAHGDMNLLVLAEEERVAQLLADEKRVGEVSPTNNIYINQLFRHLRELAELEHDLGISPHEAMANSSEQPKSVTTLREMIEARTDKKVTLERITVEPNG